MLHDVRAFRPLIALLLLVVPSAHGPAITVGSPLAAGFPSRSEAGLQRLRSNRLAHSAGAPTTDSARSASTIVEAGREASRATWTSQLDTLYRLTSSTDGPLARVVDGVITEQHIILAEASTNRVHLYERGTGKWRRSAGRTGSGPGEFRRLEWLTRVGDALYAFDAELLRVTVLSLDGRFVRTLALSPPPAARRAEPIAVLGDGSFLARRVIPSDAFSDVGAVSRPPKPMLVAPRYALSRHRADGSFVTDLLEYRGNEWFVAPYGSGGASQIGPMFGRKAAVVASGTTFAVLASDVDRVIQFDSAGARLRELRVPSAPPVPVRRQDVERERARSIPPGRGPVDFGAVFDQQVPPSHFPAFGWRGVGMAPLSGASDASMWLLRYGGVRSERSVYLRYSSRGALVDSVSFDRQMRLLDALDELMLLGAYDADGADEILLVRRRPRPR